MPVVITPLFWRLGQLDIWPGVLWLFSPFLPWVALAYWTLWRWHKDGAPASSSILDGSVALASLAVTVGLVAIGLVRGKGARIVIAYAGVLNIWLAGIGALLCVMATSGQWI
jgi:hypothetical protein